MVKINLQTDSQRAQCTSHKKYKNMFYNRQCVWGQVKDAGNLGFRDRNGATKLSYRDSSLLNSTTQKVPVGDGTSEYLPLTVPSA